MPSGGPAYPLADLGVRVRGQITPSLTALAGVFDGDPLGNNPNNKSGTNFNLHNGTLFIGELQYAINQPADGEMVGAGGGGMPGTYKVGVWYNNASFADQRFDNTGLSLADPLSTGIPGDPCAGPCVPRGRASGDYRRGRQDEDHANAAPAGAIRFAPVAGIDHVGAGRKDIGRSSLRPKLPVPALTSSRERRCTRTWVEQWIPE
jgi:carbohydrate-selective porin OprB